MKRRVLFDTCVIVDVLFKREPHAAESTKTFDMAVQGKIDGFISAHAITTLDYLLTKEFGQATSKSLIEELLNYFSIAPVTGKIIKQALSRKINDFEDAVSHYAGLSENVSVIITRNIKDFSKGEIQAVLPEVINSDLAKR